MSTNVKFEVNLNINGHYEIDTTVTFNRDSYNRIYESGGEQAIRNRIEQIAMKQLDIDIEITEVE